MGNESSALRSVKQGRSVSLVDGYVRISLGIPLKGLPSMRSLLVLGVVGALATTITAHAEPLPVTPLTPGAKMTVKVESSTAGCGQLFTGHIMLGSADGKNAVGYLELNVQGHSTRVPFDVGATAQKFAVTSSRPLSCKDGLGTPTFSVYRDSKLVETAKVKPKGFKGDQLTGASLAPGKPWIRHIGLQGTCGSPGATGNVDVFSQQPLVPVQAMVGVDFAGASKPVAAITVMPNQPAQVGVTAPAAINCEGAGIPAVKYTFANATAPNPNAGSLEATEISFEP
jgi:hypothetical protein